MLQQSCVAFYGGSPSSVISPEPEVMFLDKFCLMNRAARQWRLAGTQSWKASMFPPAAAHDEFQSRSEEKE